MKVTHNNVSLSANSCPTAPPSRRPSRGLEMLSAMGWWGYVAIIAVCVLGVLAYLITSSRAGSEATYLTQLASSTARNGHTQAGYGSSNLNTVIYNSGGVPNGFTYDSGTIFNQWNGSVVITGKKSYFTITDSGVPTSECISITQTLAAGGITNYLTVGGTKITPASDIATINTACGATNSNVSNNTVTIVMYVGAMSAS